MKTPSDDRAQIINDMKLVTELGHDKRVAILSELASFKYSMADLTFEEAEKLVGSTGATEEDVFAIFRCAYGFEEYETEESPSDAWKEAVADLREYAPKIKNEFEKIKALEYAMPSYHGISIWLNLRATPNGNRRFKLQPIANVRIVLDEGEPITFQCLPEGLLTMSRHLKHAADSLARLASQVSSKK